MKEILYFCVQKCRHIKFSNNARVINAMTGAERLYIYRHNKDPYDNDMVLAIKLTQKAIGF